jgi:hypothetical protein
MIATGMPAIATEHSDIPFVFGDMKHLLLPERDAGAIAARIEHYAANPRSVHDDGVGLARQVRERLNAAACSDRLSCIYSSLE